MAPGGGEAGVWVRCGLGLKLAWPALCWADTNLPCLSVKQSQPSLPPLLSVSVFIHWLSRSFLYSFHYPFVKWLAISVAHPSVLPSIQSPARPAWVGRPCEVQVQSSWAPKPTGKRCEAAGSGAQGSIHACLRVSQGKSFGEEEA